MGFALIAQGLDGVIWKEIGYIILSWVTSPVISGCMSFVFFYIIRAIILRSKDSFERGLYFMPLCYFLTLAVNVFFVVFKGSTGGFIDLSVIPLWGVLLLSFGTGYLAGSMAFTVLPLIRRRVETKKLAESTVILEEGKDNDTDETKEDEAALKPTFVPEKFPPETEQLFSTLQILTACFGSFAHGANDVANSIGPYAVVIGVFTTNSVDQDAPVPAWLLLGGGIGIVIGLATWGYKVIATVGNDICKVIFLFLFIFFDPSLIDLLEIRLLHLEDSILS